MAIPDIRVAAYPVKRTERMGGLDLTGLRLPVQLLGTRLLDGVTTISPIVRYVSLRAWIIRSYATAGRPDSYVEFMRFAWGVEAAIAYANLLRNPDMLGVVGSSLARLQLAAGQETIALEQLVGQGPVTAYKGPSEQIGVSLARDPLVPGLTEERGVRLAKLIERSVSHSRLGSAFSRGEPLSSATRNELEEFGSCVMLERPDEDEAEILLSAVLPAEPFEYERPRIATYAALLWLARATGANPAEDDLFRMASGERSGVPHCLWQCLDGWLQYQVRDVLALLHEHALAAVVNELAAFDGGPSGVPAATVVGAVCDAAFEAAADIGDADLELLTGNLADRRFGDVKDAVWRSTADRISQPDHVVRWTGGLTELALRHVASSSPELAAALLPVAWLLASRRADLDASANGDAVWGPEPRGLSRLGVAELIGPALTAYVDDGRSFAEVCRELVVRTVDQHLLVTWERLGADQRRDVALLACDDDRLYARVGGFAGGRTRSRLGEAIGWLRQLGLVDGGITPLGEHYLTQSLEVLDGA